MRFSPSGRVEGEDAAVVHDRDPVAELVGLLHVVRGEEDRLALVVELAEDLPEREAALRIEPGGRLVEEQDLRLCMIARATISRWAMPPDIASDRRRRPVGEADLLEQLLGLGLGLLRVMPKYRPWKKRFSYTVMARSSVLVWGTTPITCLARPGASRCRRRRRWPAHRSASRGW